MAQMKSIKGKAAGGMGGMMGGMNGPQSSPAPEREGRLGNLALAEEIPSAESYNAIAENPFHQATAEPLSTFSIDVDTASYANVRRFLAQNMLPPRTPSASKSCSITSPTTTPRRRPPAPIPSPSTSRSPAAPGTPSTGWRGSGSRPGRSTNPDGRPATSSSSSTSPARCSSPTSSRWCSGASQRLVEQLGENDQVAMVVYAGASGLVLPSTSCLHKAEILSAIEQLRAGGSTNGGAGIQLAYDVATRNFIKNGTNRVILATDGDFNVGVSDQDSTHPT